MKICKCCGVEKHEDEYNNRLTCKACVAKKLREKMMLSKLFDTPSVRTEHKHFAWLDLKYPVSVEPRRGYDWRG